MDRPYNLLFLCTGNSARSILAEALANQLAKSRFRAYSAGSHPRGRVHPMALQVLDEAGIATDGLRSKPWDEFATPDAPPMDLIITVCDKAAGEACPLWPGHPVTAHWGIEDPASVAGSQEQVHKAFGKALQLLQHRLSLLMALKPEALDRLALETRVREIGTAS
ncbi:arsenate reductase ArsC [Pseudoxanthomonas sp. LH2527]|uniref:arsenate reductase ArsC n=1 Tax=Pseudoxanthomonas sp. LH2527 TaxID=2923249 RepID=UPI001F13D4A8|nr:arsenate reductase ArsC [Pseudoxanthomonas sp. LH2527]MCH6482562.1 arsenate reductase ArsC [Pseudoxanthomonas sp. LH2527]